MLIEHVPFCEMQATYRSQPSQHVAVSPVEVVPDLKVVLLARDLGLHLGLEEGLFRKWESRRRPGMGCSKTTPNEFETRFTKAPRFTRIGFVDCPHAVVEILLPGVKLEEVRSFENLVEAVRRVHPERFEEFFERFCATVKTSGMMKRASPEEVRNDPVWRR